MNIALNALAQNLANPTGLLSYFAQLTKLLPEIDPDSHYSIIVDRSSREYYQKKNRAVNVVAAPWGNDSRYLRIFMDHFLVHDILRRQAIDILFQPGAGVAPFRLPTKTKLVLAIYALHHLSTGQIPPLIKFYRSMLFDRSIKRAQALVVNSEYSRNILLNYLGDDRHRLAVIHHGVDCDLFHDAPLTELEHLNFKSFGIEGPYILFVSKIYRYKNLDLLIEAFCRFVRQSGAPHRLVIIGSFSEAFGTGLTYRNDIVAIAHRNHLADRLIMLDTVGVGTLRQFYVGADLYVQPSNAETFGRTTIEAMACGCPVLAAAAAATPEIVGDAGVLYPPDDVDACAMAIERICSSPSIREDLRQKGLERVKAFSFKHEVMKLVALFKEMG